MHDAGIFRLRVPIAGDFRFRDCGRDIYTSLGSAGRFGAAVGEEILLAREKLLWIELLAMEPCKILHRRKGMDY